MSLTKTIRVVNLKVNEAHALLLPWFDRDNSFLNFRPSNGGWSALQILEHVMFTSHYLLVLIDKGSSKAIRRAQTTKVNVDWSHYVLNTNELDEIGIHKSFDWIRPNHMEPTGELSINEIKNKISEQFSRCLDQLDVLKNGEGVLCRTTMSVNNIGKLDVYQYIYFLALHAIRHVSQLKRNEEEYLRIVK
jgi:hypothetical protein